MRMLQGEDALRDAMEAPKSFRKDDRVTLKGNPKKGIGTITSTGLLMVWVRWDASPKEECKHYPQDLAIQTATENPS